MGKGNQLCGGLIWVTGILHQRSKRGLGALWTVPWSTGGKTEAQSRLSDSGWGWAWGWG